MANNSESCQSDSNRLFINSSDSDKTCNKKSSSDCSVKCATKSNSVKGTNIVLSSCDSDSEHISSAKSINYENSCSKSHKSCSDNINSIDCTNDKIDTCFPKHKMKSEGCILSERNLVNKMISNYYNPQSISVSDNREVLKKLLPIYNSLINTCISFVEKVSKIQHNLNPTKSSKMFRIIYESYKTLVFNLHRSISSILEIKHRGFDVIDHTINNVESASNNRINFASCNNFYETDDCLSNSTLFYSVPGLTILINHSTLSYRIIAKKSNYNSSCKVFKYDFLLVPGAASSCNKVNKRSFLKVLESISNFRSDSANNILEFINFLHHESKSIKCIL